MQNIMVVLKALADPTRASILKTLMLREFCVCELAELFHVSQPCISQHLKRLRLSGLVYERREGAWTYYSANLERAAEVVEAFRSFMLETPAEVTGVDRTPEELRAFCRSRAGLR